MKKMTVDRRTQSVEHSINIADAVEKLRVHFSPGNTGQGRHRRSTFYTHYRDKNELLIDGLQGLREYLQNAQKLAASTSTNNYEKVIGFSMAMFEHAHDHKGIFLSLDNGQGWTIVSRNLEEIIVQLMK